MASGTTGLRTHLAIAWFFLSVALLLSAGCGTDLPAGTVTKEEAADAIGAALVNGDGGAWDDVVVDGEMPDLLSDAQLASVHSFRLQQWDETSEGSNAVLVLADESGDSAIINFWLRKKANGRWYSYGWNRSP